MVAVNMASQIKSSILSLVDVTTKISEDSMQATMIFSYPTTNPAFQKLIESGLVSYFNSGSNIMSKIYPVDPGPNSSTLILNNGTAVFLYYLEAGKDVQETS